DDHRGVQERGRRGGDRGAAGDHRRPRPRAGQHVLAGQPHPRAGAVPRAPLGRPHARRGDPPEDRPGGLRGGQARQPARDPRGPAGGRHGPGGRSGPPARRDPHRRQAHEQDPRDRHGRPHGDRRAGDQHAQAQRGAAPVRRLLSRRPGVLPVLARRRADRGGRLLAPGRPLRPHPRPRHLHGGGAAHGRDRGDRRGRRAQAAQVLHRLQPQAALHGPPGDARDLHGGHARARPAARDAVRRVLRLRRLHEGPRDRRAAHDVRAGDARRRRALRRVEARLPAPRRRGVHPPARLGQGRGGRRHVRPADRGGARGQGGHEARAQPRRQVPGRRDRQGRLGLAPRPLRHPAARPGEGRPGGDDVLALRGRGAELLRPAPGARGVARDRRALPRAVRHLRRLGDVRLHERPQQAVGRLPRRDRHRDLGVPPQRGELAGVGRAQARGLRGDAEVRRLHHGLPRRHPRGRRRARPDRDGQRLARGEGHQARAGPEQRHEPRQAVARRGLRGRGGEPGM
ncbi:MAG: Predicted glycolate dehydrogenase, 2-subunit type, iron-sulfur subunit GlcD, partial [uncultured Solirubrobacteraceae bacterium]